ncbi:unnamed protein product [Adineta steineri]|uniref:G-protein coupled receptors family 1 profile domain-containing protein n=1 Tax=Adineta steineri TaxID=433720 RepID=A0A814QI20_9BILA|nr:unnamed protein product [Adineta steineri]CAF1459137.1 unnamed protein product [Adineta steineri]
MNISSPPPNGPPSSNSGPPRPGGPPPMPTITALQNDIALYGYALLYILALFGHISSFLIFLRPILNRISTSCLFIALTITDSIYLLVSIYDFINIGFEIRDSSKDPSAICRFRNFIQWTAMCSNAWLLVAIVTDRWIRVKFPFKSKQICTPRNALIITIIIVILSAGFNAHILEPSYGQLPAGIMTVCGPKPTNAIYNTFVRQIWPTIFSCIQTLIPVILLMIFSIDTFRRLARQTRIQNTHQGRRRTHLDNQMLLIMLATILLFVATTLPLGLFNILLTPVLVGKMTQTQLLQLSSIFTFIAAINYTFNFYIHCLTSRLFRQELLYIYKCRNRNTQIGVATNTIRLNPTGIAMTQIQVK